MNLEFADRLNWGFDGADEVERGTFRLIKGGGGASYPGKIPAGGGYGQGFYDRFRQ